MAEVTEGTKRFLSALVADREVQTILRFLRNLDLSKVQSVDQGYTDVTVTLANNQAFIADDVFTSVRKQLSNGVFRAEIRSKPTVTQAVIRITGAK